MHALAHPSTAPEPSEVPWGWSPLFRMPLYKPGARVRHGSSWETVSHVGLRRHEMTVYLVGRTEPVDPMELELAPTVFTTARVHQPQ